MNLIWDGLGGEADGRFCGEKVDMGRRQKAKEQDTFNDGTITTEEHVQEDHAFL
jgi:hypothetical protein